MDIAFVSVTFYSLHCTHGLWKNNGKLIVNLSQLRLLNDAEQSDFEVPQLCQLRTYIDVDSDVVI